MEENFLPQDKLDELIVERLRERQRKVDRMGELEARQGRVIDFRPRRVISAVAACAVLLVVVAPFVFQQKQTIEDVIGRFTTEQYRAASPEVAEVQTLIDNHRYAEAIRKAKIILTRSDSVIREFGDMSVEFEDEELMYEVEAEKTYNADVRWMYIRVLLMAGEDKAAEKELNIYIKHLDWCDNADEALALQQAIKEKPKNSFERWVTFYKSLLK